MSDDDRFELQVQEVDDPERLTAFEVGRTPTPLVRAIVRRVSGLRDWSKPRHLRILDPGAGSGVFGMVARSVWPEANIVAVEPRSEEIENLRRHYDDVINGPLEDFWRVFAGSFDLIIGNPPFSKMLPGDDGRPSWLDNLRGCLREDGLLSLLLRSDAFWRRQEVAEWFLESVRGRWIRLPEAQDMVPGRIAFYGSSSTAVETYSLFHWQKIARDVFGWPAALLPVLPREQLRWVTKPGCER